jgi:hypothetical protein
MLLASLASEKNLMKNLNSFILSCCGLLLTFVFSVSDATAVVITEHDISTANANTSNTVNLAYSDADVSASTMVSVGALGMPFNSAQSFCYLSWPTGGALDPTRYYEFSITPNAGFEIQYTHVALAVASGGSGTGTFEIHASLDGFGASDITLGTQNFPIDSTWHAYTMSAAALGTQSGTVTFRFYMYNVPTNGYSGLGVNPQFGNQGQKLFVNGTVMEAEDFSKEIISGPDLGDPGDGEIDLAVEVGLEDPSIYDFKINYNQPDLPPVQIEDTVPAEWSVALLDDTLNCEVPAQANKGKKDDKSATKIVCQPETTEGMVTVWATARCHGNRNNSQCRPTSCGALYLNDGAAAYELDPNTGEPMLDIEGNRLPPLVESNNLCLVAVSDLNGGGIDYTGDGDEDGDGLLDHNEACGIGTDPCLEDTDGDGVSDFDEVASGCMDPLNPDTDGDTISDGDELNNGTDPCDDDSDDDGVRDDVDNCPLEGPPNESLGEILDPNGCLRQSQCSDGDDNDNDGPIDFAGGDQSCEDILDDSEDTTDPSINLDDVFASYSSENRDVHIWKTPQAAILADHVQFCANRGLDWWSPKSAADAQQLIDSAFALDSYHTWIQVYGITTATGLSATINGFSVVVDSPSCAAPGSASGWAGFRKWGCSFCDPESLTGLSYCWDISHLYDWFVCETN